MPVTVRFERQQLAELYGGGYVAKIANTSGRFLAVQALMENETLNETASRVVELPPERDSANPVIFGPEQAWKFVSGETLTLTHQDYQPLTVVVP
jgi:hypothetical protein